MIFCCKPKIDSIDININSYCGKPNNKLPLCVGKKQTKHPQTGWFIIGFTRLMVYSSLYPMDWFILWKVYGKALFFPQPKMQVLQISLKPNLGQKKRSKPGNDGVQNYGLEQGSLCADKSRCGSKMSTVYQGLSQIWNLGPAVYSWFITTIDKVQPKMRARKKYRDTRIGRWQRQGRN